MKRGGLWGRLLACLLFFSRTIWIMSSCSAGLFVTEVIVFLLSRWLLALQMSELQIIVSLPLVLTCGVNLFKKRVVFNFHLLCLREPPSCLNTQSDQNQNEPDFLAVWLNPETQEPVSYLSELHRFLSVAMTADGPTHFVKAAPPHRFDPGQTVLTRNARRFLSVRAIRLPITLVSEREEKPPVIFIRLLRFSSFCCIL